MYIQLLLIQIGLYKLTYVLANVNTKDGMGPTNSFSNCCELLIQYGGRKFEKVEQF